jgi:hydroxyacylglutathione hydrolase
MIEIRQFPCLSDNYGFLVHDPDSGETAAIDTPDAGAILAAAAAEGWRLTQIWNTHWHADHAGGNAALVDATGARVLGPAEVSRIAAAPDRTLVDGDTIALGTASARVIEVGGHTLGHIAYVFDADRAAFVGDTLFSLGCGRLFEGTAQQMWESLQKLAALPDDTLCHCAHEYTASNARFALSVDPGNPALVARAAEVERLRAASEPTVPMRLSMEKATNPFLRAPALKASLGMPDAADWEAFGELRRRKDSFR